MIVTELTVGDVPRACELLAAAFQSVAAKDKVEIHQERSRQGWRTFVIKKESLVVGTISLLVERKYTRDGACVGHIEDLAVRENERNNGVGSALVNHCLDLCHKERCYKVILNCLPELREFYQRLGFKCFESQMRYSILAT